MNSIKVNQMPVVNKFLAVVNGKAWCDTDSERKKYNLESVPPYALVLAVDVIANDLNLDFPTGSSDYSAKIYKKFLNFYYEDYCQYYRNLRNEATQKD